MCEHCDRAEMIRALMSCGYDEQVATHMVDRQIIPQAVALADEDTSTHVVATERVEGWGHQVTCHYCPATAWMSQPPDPSRIIACPDCTLRWHG